MGKIEKIWGEAEFGSLKGFVRRAFPFSFFLTVLSYAFLWSIEIEESTSLIISLGLFFGALAFLAYLPKFKKEKTKQEFEKKLAFALMDLSLTLDIGEGFEQSLLLLGKKDYGLAGKELCRIAQSSKERGTGIIESAGEMGKRIDSLNARRTASKIAHSYSEGSKGRGKHLRDFASELLEEQKTNAVSFTAKSSFYSLLFIAFSALVPALFQALLIAGSLFMEISIRPLHAFAIITLLFPLVNIAVLVVLWEKTPSYLKN